MKPWMLSSLTLLTALGMAFASCTDERDNDNPEQEEQKPVIPDTPEEKPDEKPEDSANTAKILVVYYSHSGNTQTIAGYIHDAVKGDIFRVETVNPYPENYDEHLAQARREMAENHRSPLTDSVANIADYDVVFVGYPIWVETAAPPIASFLEKHDLKGKTVVPFCTSGTSSAAESYRLVNSLCPESTVLEGIQIRRGTYDTAKERVLAWLEKLGF